MMPGQRAVVDDPPQGDDHHPAAQRHHVLHVVARQQDRHAADLLVVLQEGLDVVLGDHVQADGGLVEEQHVGRVQQRGDQLHLHPLAQRQLADRLREQPAHAEHVGQLVAGALEPLGLDAIDLLVQAERLGGGQVPPELVLLAHHQGEAAAIGVFAPPGHEAHHPGRAAGGRDHAGEEFQGGGFAGPVRAQKGDELALFDPQVDAADRLDQPILAAEQPADGGGEPFLLLVHAVGLRQPFDFDDGHNRIIIGPAQSGGKGRK